MEIKEFIRDALVNIRDGIELANRDGKYFSTMGGDKKNYSEEGNYVSFDIAVIANEANQTKIDGKIKANVSKKLLILTASINGDLKAQVEKTINKEYVHRIQFKVFMRETPR
jgi:hypothetical protein